MTRPITKKLLTQSTNLKQLELRTKSLINLIDSWLDEDIGRGDLSTIALEQKVGAAYWISKDRGIFCGGRIVQMIFERIDRSVEINLLIKDGDGLEANQTIIELNGPTKSLLAGERTALNIAMHLSGIATKTFSMVKELKGTGIKLADTRKTTPGLRILEKYATRCGGGTNHRFGLDDAAMLKENHLAWSGDLTQSLKSIRKQASWPSRIIVEAENEQQAVDAVNAGADAVLLDEMTPKLLKQLIPQLRTLAKQRGKDCGPTEIVLEASGIKPMELKDYADTGIDLISSSAPITRSNWIDFSMRFNK